MLYSRQRFDALTDGVFAIAMTLLVLELRIPEGVTAGDFPRALAENAIKLWVYALSFASLGLAWLGRATLRDASDSVRRGEALLTLVYLFLVTLVPFASLLVGRFENERLALWFYCADLGGIGAISAALRFMLPRAGSADGPGRRIGTSLLLACTAALAAALALRNPDGRVLWVFALNAAGPFLDRWLKRRDDEA